MRMSSGTAALAELWRNAGGDAAALSRLTLTGAEPVLPSSFRVGIAAQVSIAAAALAAAEFHRQRTGMAQAVTVDLRHSAAEFRSERYLRIIGQEPPAAWDALAGVYRTQGGRHVRLHTNFPHHRQAILDVLRCAGTREAVQAALSDWDAIDFETMAYARSGVVAAMRSPSEWAAHPQGKAVATLPVLSITRIGAAAPRPLPPGERPLSGVRVLDLSRVIAGPVAGRTLAAHGADVLLIASPKLPSIPWLVIDTGRGKRSAQMDLTTPTGRTTLTGLLAGADIISQGYRPQSIASLGFSPEEAARIRPGIVYVSLSAYGASGPWAGRRGFDSLVQTTTGINHAEAEAAGVDGPKELPAQALDHASGYLMAFAAMLARARQAREGGSWHVQVSLAQTGRWLAGLGRLDDGFAVADPTLADIGDLLEESASGFGRLRGVRHAGVLSATPARWDLPAVPLGTHEPVWNTP
jgi:crotonobetainyl-CoA:carnitine CoA-transferase CaiB-like acyl-CoA transferase